MPRLPRRALLSAAPLAAAAVLPARAGGPEARPELTWRLSSGFPKSLDVLFGACESFARIVGEATEGRFRIQPSGPGEAVAADGLLDAVAAGRIEMGHGSATLGMGRDPAFALASAAPFGLNARGQSAWWLQGGGGDLFADLFARHGLVALPAGNTGAQMGGWFRREIKAPADLQGLKMRVAGLGAQVMARLGSQPQALAGTDLLAALEAKTLDAAEWIGPHDDERLGLARIAPVYHFPGFWEGSAMQLFWFNAEQWKALPATYRAVLQAAAAQASTEVQARYDARNPQALRRLVSAGALLRPFPQEVIEAAFKASNDLYGELSGKSPDFKRIYEAMRAFRNGEYLWFQVAEYTYDNFMIRARSRG